MKNPALIKTTIRHPETSGPDWNYAEDALEAWLAAARREGVGAGFVKWGIDFERDVMNVAQEQWVINGRYAIPIAIVRAGGREYVLVRLGNDVIWAMPRGTDARLVADEQPNERQEPVTWVSILVSELEQTLADEAPGCVGCGSRGVIHAEPGEGWEWCPSHDFTCPVGGFLVTP